MTSIGVYRNKDKCEARRADDFYPTPWEPVEALCLAEADSLKRLGKFWEPACGDGALAEMLILHGYEVWSSDLVDRGYGQGNMDFLKCTKAVERSIVTNPPFNIAEDFIRHGFDLGCGYIALLLKAHYFHADCRVKLWRECRPARVYPLAWRVDFTGGGANHTDCSWYVWDATHKGHCLYMDPMERPRIRGQRILL